jgi:hypothetical protein
MDNNVAYDMFREVIAAAGDKNQYYIIGDYMKVSLAKFKADSTHREQFIQDYTISAEYIASIENKVKKVVNGFYGDFKEFGLYIFTKDDMTPEDLLAAMKLTMELQAGANYQFQTLYISEVQNLYVCDVATLSYKQYPISDELCKKFFINSL